MNGQELKAKLAELGLTQTEFSKYIRVNIRTVQRWVREEVPVPETIIVILRYMEFKKSLTKTAKI